MRDHHAVEMSGRAAHHRVPVAEPSQPSAARFAAHAGAAQAGFGPDDIHRAGLVATELATNLVKHATGGEVLVRAVSSNGAGELELLSIDRGPGMSDVARSLADGHSTSGTAGNGLGAIRRLSDEFHIHSTAGRGTVIVARLRSDRRAPRPNRPFAVGTVCVPVSGETLCGDTWSVHYGPESLTLLVADGLGHGPLAAEAADAVRDVFVERRGSPPAETLEAVHGSVRHTRGAAAAIAEVRPGDGVVSFAGIGNVAGAIVSAASVRQAVSHNGTLGHEARHFREYTYPWEATAMLVMHSDGLKSHWSLDGYPGARRQDAAVVAALLYRDFNRGRDDVTVLVARTAE